MLSRLEREKCVKEEEARDSVAGRKISTAAQAWQGMTPEEEASFKAAGGISRGEASSYRNFDYLNQLSDVEAILSKRFNRKPHSFHFLVEVLNNGMIVRKQHRYDSLKQELNIGQILVRLK